MSEAVHGKYQVGRQSACAAPCLQHAVLLSCPRRCHARYHPRTLLCNSHVSAAAPGWTSPGRRQAVQGSTGSRGAGRDGWGPVSWAETAPSLHSCTNKPRSREFAVPRVLPPRPLQSRRRTISPVLRYATSPTAQPPRTPTHKAKQQLPRPVPSPLHLQVLSEAGAVVLQLAGGVGQVLRPAAAALGQVLVPAQWLRLVPVAVGVVGVQDCTGVGAAAAWRGGVV